MPLRLIKAWPGEVLSNRSLLLPSVLSGAAAGTILLSSGAAFPAVLVFLAGLAPVFLTALHVSPGEYSGQGTKRLSVLETITSLRSLTILERSFATIFLSLAVIYLHSSIWPDAGNQLSLVLLAPVEICALLFGIWFGVAASLTIAALAYFSQVEPRFTMRFQDWNDVLETFEFLAVALCAALILQTIYKVIVSRKA